MFGIIGGLGPIATTQFYSTLINRVSSRVEGRLPRLLIYSIAMSPQIENAFLQGKVTSQSPERVQVRNLLNEAVNYFLRNQVEILAMPCNTLQDELSSICQTRNILNLNMVDETAKAILKANVKRLFVLGTASTCRDNLYGQRLARHHIECVYPKETQQNFIEKYIRDALDQNLNQELKNTFSQMVKEKAKGCDGILIACTDLTGDVSSELCHLQVFDSLQLLAQASAEHILTKKELFI